LLQSLRLHHHVQPTARNHRRIWERAGNRYHSRGQTPRGWRKCRWHLQAQSWRYQDNWRVSLSNFLFEDIVEPEPADRVQAAMTKTLTNIKGLSEAKVLKIKEAASKLKAGGFVSVKPLSNCSRSPLLSSQLTIWIWGWPGQRRNVWGVETG